MITIITGDCLHEIPKLEPESIQCCVTSPPYWGLRDYGVPPTDWPEVIFVPVAGLPSITVPPMTCCHGLEPDPWAFVAHEVLIFREVRRALKQDGICWVNMGDSYASVGGAHGGRSDNQAGVGAKRVHQAGGGDQSARKLRGDLKNKDLCGIPWMVAKALQADGWYLRCDIIWHKPNPMPESVTDRPTKAHEYIFLLTKSERYFYDAEAVKEPVSGTANARGNGVNPKAKTPGKNSRLFQDRDPSHSPARNVKQNESFSAAVNALVDFRNKRSVWSVGTYAYSEAHFATYPPDLIKPCILAGSRPGDIVLDPFGGSGTTGQVALELGRRAVLIELGPHNVKLIEQRTHVTPGLAL